MLVGRAYTPKYLPALLATFSFPRLTEAVLKDVGREPLDDVMVFLRACSSTLERLRVILDGMDYSIGNARQHAHRHDLEGESTRHLLTVDFVSHN